MIRIKITGWLLGVVVVAVGCQSKPAFAPVEGTITQGGKPLAGVVVDFYPEPGTRGPRSTSTPTDETGHYRLHSSEGEDAGAIVGPHRICILDVRNGRRPLLSGLPKDVVNDTQNQQGQTASRVPRRYSYPNETPLRSEVQPGPQSLNFDIPQEK